MNKSSDYGSSISCPSRIDTRFPVGGQDPAPLGDEVTCDLRRNDNQDDTELYQADNDDDDGDFDELTAETSSLASSDSSNFVCDESRTITAIRVRPMLPLEKKSGYRFIVDMNVNDDGVLTKIVNPTALPHQSRNDAPARDSKRPVAESTAAADLTNFPDQFTQEFRFDYSYGPLNCSDAHQVTTQSTVYDNLGVLALQTVLVGHNCSIFTYGQPGAGKTYTMLGSSSERTPLPVSVRANGSYTRDSGLSTSERRGLIPRICQGLFAEMGKGKSAIMSYVEIYDERVYDLLSPATSKKPLKVREHPEDGAFVEGVQRLHVTSSTQAIELIERVNRTRSVASSRLARSHTVLILSLTRNGTGESSADVSKKSKLCLVDLAGSERVDHSVASGSRLREVASVNRSLTTLADVVGALAKRRSNRSMDGFHHQKVFVPYRNSILTRLLKENLGGCAKTIILGAISPCCEHYDDTIATLRYIERMKSVHSTTRTSVEVNGDMTQRFLIGASELKASLCASDAIDDPTTVPDTYEGPEHHEEYLDCGSCARNSRNDNVLPTISRDTSSQERTHNIVYSNQKSEVNVEIPSARARQAQDAGRDLRKSVMLLNLAAIRRRWQTLRLYRAFDRWRKLPALDEKSTDAMPLKLRLESNEKDGQNDGSFSTQILSYRKTGWPPLPSHTPTAEARTAGRVRDVVAAVEATDAICCSVVHDFLFSRHPNSSKPLTQQANTTALASLLEILASSSEFDRPDFHFNLSQNSSNHDNDLEELASSEDWYNTEDEEFTLTVEVGASGSADEREALCYEGTPPLLSPEPPGQENPVYSSLSVCVDSIDMARRMLGPGVRNLRSRSSTSGTGVECELLRYLDKRLIMMARSLEELMVTLPLSGANSRLGPSQCSCEALEIMVGEFCLQIVARLCDQLPGVSSACVAGRLQLEGELERFCDCLRRQLLPEVARSEESFGVEENSVNTVFFVAIELLVMAERIKLVWNLVGHQKRERLLQNQALEAAAIKDRKMAARIASLEECNAKLSARRKASLVANGRSADSTSTEVNYREYANRMPNHDKANSELLEMEDTPDISSLKHDGRLGEKQALEIARTRDVQARNDELQRRFAALNLELAAAGARVTALEAENCRLSSRAVDPVPSFSETNSTTLYDRVDSQQKESERAHNHAHGLERQLAVVEGVNREQTTQLEDAKALLSCEKEARNMAETNVNMLRTQTNALVEDIKRQLTGAQARDAKSKARQQAANDVLVDTQARNTESSALLSQAKAELLFVLEKDCQDESESILQSAVIEDLNVKLCTAQAHRESAEMLAEEIGSKYVALVDRVSAQDDQICRLEKNLFQNEQSLRELMSRLAKTVQERDEYTLLLSQTEEALASALGRENVLQGQLNGSAGCELDEINRLNGELHESTLELAALREELAELLDHSTLQSATMETLKLEQTDLLARMHELELERDEVVLRCETEQDTWEQKVIKCQKVAQHFTQNLCQVERQLEIERQESMNMHETFQRQTNAFRKLHARQHSIKMDYCSTIRDLKAQVDTLSAESRTLNEELIAKANELDATHSVAEVQIQKLEEKSKVSEVLVRQQDEIARSLTGQLQDCRMDLTTTTRRWICAEIQRGLLRVCIQRLDSSLTEAKDVCLMQLADAESSQFQEDSGYISTRRTDGTQHVVNEHLTSVDEWFDEVISGNQTMTEIPTSDGPGSVQDEDTAGRSSLVKTLTDLSALTNELLVVCEGASDADTQSNNSTHEDSGQPRGPTVTTEYKQVARRKEKELSSELAQLRKIVMKMKEALEAKDEMLLFLDAKVRRLEGLNT